MNRALDDQLYFALKKECMPPYDPTIGGKQKNIKKMVPNFFICQNIKFFGLGFAPDPAPDGLVTPCSPAWQAT